MQLRALRQFSKQIVTHASIRRYRLLCALLPAVWLLFQVLGAGTAVVYGQFLPHSTFPAQLLWLAFLIGFRLVQLAATVPLQYQLLACCTSLAGLQAKTPYSLRTAYCLQLLTGLLRTLLFLPVPLLGAWGYRMTEDLLHCAVITHSGIISNMLAGFGLPKIDAKELLCEPGEGFDILVTAQLWQRSQAFEILGKTPYSE